MARTPVPGSKETKVTAFLVTPDMPGSKYSTPGCPRCIRGTATGRFAFENMLVPKENILATRRGPEVALTVLDFGRITFGATCTGAAKFCCSAAQHANTRVQFGQPLGEFELVKKKIAYMAADAFAMEATTIMRRLIDSRRRRLHARNRHAQGLRPPTRSGGSSTTRSRSTAARPTSPMSRTNA